MAGQLHAGQLRYHVSVVLVLVLVVCWCCLRFSPRCLDLSLLILFAIATHSKHRQDFSKLRELHQGRLSAAGGSYSSVRSFHSLPRFVTWNGGTSSLRFQLPTLQQHQNRSLFSLSNTINSKWENLQLKGLETVANSRPNDPQAQYEFLSKLVATHPLVVVDRVSHPMFRHFALDRRIAVLYLQALRQTQRHSSFDLDDLVARLQEHDPIVGVDTFLEQSRKRTKGEQVAGLIDLLHGGAGAAGMTAMAGASPLGGGAGGPALGNSPKHPVHVQMHNPTSTRAALIALTGRVLIAFVVVSALSALMDEKGVGRGLGMNSNSKHVQQVQDKSNVTFDDVKGVDEAKAELQEIVMYLKNPTKFTRLGGKLPRYVVLGLGPFLSFLLDQKASLTSSLRLQRIAFNGPTRYWENFVGQGNCRRSRCSIFL